MYPAGLSGIGGFPVLEPGEMAQMPTMRWPWWTQLQAACLTPGDYCSLQSVAEAGRSLFRETEMELAENADSPVGDHTALQPASAQGTF